MFGNSAFKHERHRRQDRNVGEDGLSLFWVSDGCCCDQFPLARTGLLKQSARKQHACILQHACSEKSVIPVKSQPQPKIIKVIKSANRFLLQMLFAGITSRHGLWISEDSKMAQEHAISGTTLCKT